MDIILAFAFLFSCIFLVTGIISPKAASRLFRKDFTRRSAAKTFGLLAIASFIAFGFVAPPPAETPTPTSANTTASKTPAESTSEPSTAREPTATATTIDNDANKTITSNDRFTTATVTKVVDGDTITVSIDGKTETIRMIGVNTPETVDPRKPVECFGKEASARTKEMLNDKMVLLEADASQGERDKYGRLLRYVFIDEQNDFGLSMITDGYAYEYTYNTPYKYQSAYKAAQKAAEAAKRGLWAPDACATQTSSPTPTPTTTSVAQPNPTPAPTPTAAPNGSCTCTSNIYNCGDFSTHAAAQAVYECCLAKVGTDIHRLDGNDNDGLACESLP